jgi:hypothetical protein
VTDGPPAGAGRHRTIRDLALGIGASFFVLWLTFFGSAGAVEVFTLVAAVGALIWFASVDPERLVDGNRRPHPMVFGLSLLAGALVLTSMLVMQSATLFLVVAVMAAALVIGLTRAVRHGFGIG